MPSRTKRASDYNEYEEGGRGADLIKRARGEVQRLGGDLTIPMKFDIEHALALAALLQLSLRHPHLPETSQVTARIIIDDIRERFRAAGYIAITEMLDMGDNPKFDTHV